MIEKLYSIIIFQSIIQKKNKVLPNNAITRLGLIIQLKIASSLLFTLQDFKFIGFSYKIVYVGAISILFIFTIKLIDTRLVEKFTVDSDKKTNRGKNLKIPEIPVLAIILIEGILGGQNTSSLYEIFPLDWSSTFYSLNDVQIFGLSQYLYHPFYIVIIGLLLFVVLVGILRMARIRNS